MTVKRIVANIASDAVEPVKRFYEDLFGLETVMDLGWIATLAAPATPNVQISIASEGGSGTPVPDMSIEVDDVDVIHVRAQEMGLEIVYGPADEPWGVRRFYVRDPAGKLLNILSHSA
ncbi:MAG: VOC family protein [Pseudomonadota bacterium]